MYCIEISNGINDLMSLYYYLGIWHRGDTPTVKETRIKLFCSFYGLLLPISLMTGSIQSKNRVDAILLAEVTLLACVLYLKLLYIIWRKDQILEMLHRNVGDNLLQQLIHLGTLVYYVADIFMIMYLGNEIMVSSDQLSYCLFESNWIDQSEKNKQLAITFGELLKQPHEIVVGVIYPLTLETFTRILKFAYNSFNILKKFK